MQTVFPKRSDYARKQTKQPSIPRACLKFVSKGVSFEIRHNKSDTIAITSQRQTSKR